MKLIKKFLFLLICAGSLSAQINQSSIENKFRLAKSYEQANDFGKAKVIYEELITLQPWNNQFMYSLNEVYLKTKDFGSSEKLLKEKIQLTPFDVNLYGMLGSTYYQMGEFGKSEGIWDEGLTAGNNPSVSHRVIANYAIENRAFDKAIEILRAGQKLVGDPKTFSYELASIYSATMKFNEAVSEYCFILSEQPTQLDMIKNRIMAFLERPEAAEDAISAVNLWIEKSNLSVHKELLAFLLMQSKKYNDALTIISSLEKETNSNGSLMLNFAQAAFQNKFYETAGKAFQIIIDEYSHSAFASIAKVSFAKTSEAIIDQRIKDKFDWKPYSHFDNSGGGEYDNVINAYYELVQNYAQDNVRNESLYRIGVIYFDKKNELDKAKSVLTELVEKSPLSNYAAAANLKLAEIYVHYDEFDFAAEKCLRVISSAKSSEDQKKSAKLLLAKIEFWKANFNAASAHLSEIILDLNDKNANDAIELAVIINTAKNDSLGLADYAEADKYIHQRKFTDAASSFEKLSNLGNNQILSKLAEYKFAVMLIQTGEYVRAAELLEKISAEDYGRIYSDKSLFLLGQLYEFALGDESNAQKVYSQFLDKFPNSIYFDRCRELLLNLNNKLNNAI